MRLLVKPWFRTEPVLERDSSTPVTGPSDSPMTLKEPEVMTSAGSLELQLELQYSGGLAK